MRITEAWTAKWLRAGCNNRENIQIDLLWLLGLGSLLIATGIGLRDPWPADEPRFALVARDMVLTNSWLVPRVGGDIYADKPPVFFWLIALGFKVTGSLRFSFLLPSLASGLGSVVLVYDLARRLWSREIGLIAGGLLLVTIQFVWQARQAQIDATLCFWTTLSLYGLLRHLLLGPKWRWYAMGWVAAGLGVITKGVGFLPLLILVPFALLRSRKWSPRVSGGSPLAWLIGPAAFLVTVGAWLMPVLLAARADPALAAYRDEILFQQTVGRYSNAWHHNEPVWYFIVNVIPGLWLPLTLIVPWLIPKWREALRQHDMRIALLLSWVLIVVVFFSFSSGKRGVYVLPAVPALALACAPYIAELLQKRAVQRTLYALAIAIPSVCIAAVLYVLLRADKRTEVLIDYGIDPLGPLALMGMLGVVACIAFSSRRALAAYACVLTAVLLVISFWVNPVLNPERSGQQFVARIERVAEPSRELGIVAFKEQYLLNITRPIVHFGHARWREAEQEAFDAAAWLASDAQRQLIVNDAVRTLCFAQSEAVPLGAANRLEWFLVQDTADPSCIRRGRAAAAMRYRPPT